MRDWFESLETRERLFVSIGAVVVAIAELRPPVAMPQPVQGARSRPAVAANQSPVVIVDTTLRNRSLGQPKRSQPTPNGIRVEFENVPFDDLVLWLGDLSTQYAMEVQSGSLSTAAQGSPGRINATLTIERAL